MYLEYKHPLGQRYSVKIIYDLAEQGVVLYEVDRDIVEPPWIFIVPNFDSHDRFFHRIWGLDQFDNDHWVMARLWVELMKTPWRPHEYEISLEEEDDVFVYRGESEQAIVQVMTGIFVDFYQKFPRDIPGR